MTAAGINLAKKKKTGRPSIMRPRTKEFKMKSIKGVKPKSQ